MNERGEENVNFLRISVQTSYPYSQSLTLLSIWRCYKIILSAFVSDPNKY